MADRSGVRRGTAPAPDLGPKTIFIHVCQNSPIARRRDLLTGDGRRVEFTECLDECTVCERVPFAYVQGELLRGASCEVLAGKINARIARLRKASNR